MRYTAFKDLNICNLLMPLRKLYSTTFTYSFKVNYLKCLYLGNDARNLKMPPKTSTDSNIFHRLVLLRILYYVTLTYLFEVKYLKC